MLREAQPIFYMATQNTMPREARQRFLQSKTRHDAARSAAEISNQPVSDQGKGELNIAFGLTSKFLIRGTGRGLKDMS